MKKTLLRYPFSLSKLGWANIDRFYDDPRTENVELEVNVAGLNTYSEIHVNLVMEYRNMYIPSFKKSNGNYSFTHGEDEKYTTLPFGEQGVVFITARKGEEIYFARHSFIIGEKKTEKVELQKTDVENLKSEIKKIENQRTKVYVSISG